MDKKKNIPALLLSQEDVMGVVTDMMREQVPIYLKQLTKMKGDEAFSTLADILKDMRRDMAGQVSKNIYEQIHDIPDKPIIDTSPDEEFYTHYIRKLYNDYIKCMTHKGYIEKRLSLINKYNTIDIRDIIKSRSDYYKKNSPGHSWDIGFDTRMMPPTMEQEDKDAILTELDWFLGIPIFDEGVILVSNDLYYKYKLLNIDLASKKISFHLEEYTSIFERWVMRHQINFNIEFMHENVVKSIEESKDESADIISDQPLEVMCDIRSEVSTLNIFTRFINSEELKWTQKEKNMYLATIGNMFYFIDKGTNPITENAAITLSDIDKKCDAENGNIHIAERNIYYFMCLWVLINTELYIYKNKKISNEHIKINTSLSDKPDESKTVRRINNIIVTSNEEPKDPIDRLTIKYKKVCWINRGGLRRTKLGKVVQVRPSIHYRHALKELFPDAKPSPAAIKLVENYNEQEGDDTDES